MLKLTLVKSSLLPLSHTHVTVAALIEGVPSFADVPRPDVLIISSLIIFIYLIIIFSLCELDYLYTNPGNPFNVSPFKN